MNDKHIKKAEKILAKINMKELGEMVRLKCDYDFIVQYPPPLTMEPITGATIHA